MKTLLVDADIVVYTASLKPTEAEVYDSINSAVSFFKWKTKCDEVLMVLSDRENFRKTLVDSNYKSNRGPKPENFGCSLAYVEANYRTIRFPTLEADDTMGVLATQSPGAYIIVSADKDLRQIPGELFNPRHPEDGVVTITKLEGDYWFYTQVITGDSTDGYSGIPGKGTKAVPKILGELGEKTEAEMWVAIEEAYVKHFTVKLTPADEAEKFAKAYALTQARLARILQESDYDWVTEELTLWTPPNVLIEA